MKFIETPIPGCYEISPKILTDVRGKFVKTFHKDFFVEKGLEFNFAEEYFTLSKKGVLRGMHFQLPPSAHVKLVYCIDGMVLDVLVDLRKGSPVYGKATTFKLTSENATILYVTIGVAHGFYTLSEVAVMVYKTSTVHEPKNDTGILWSSFDIWPSKNPILSDRDKMHLKMDDFVSPFEFKP